MFENNNWVRSLLGVKRINKRRMEMRVGVKCPRLLKKKLVKNRLKWHVARTGGGDMAMSADAQEVNGSEEDRYCGARTV